MSQSWNDLARELGISTLSPDARPELFLLITIAIATVFLWQIPGGKILIYPFTILATWFHEMGHGLMGIILGGDFERLEIEKNGNGLARCSGNFFLGRIGNALFYAAGSMFPPIIGGGLIIASRNLQISHNLLVVLGLFLIFSAIVWVRTSFGILVIPLLGFLILVIALKTPLETQKFTTQFIGIQACISTFKNFGYLFTYQIPGGFSDTARIAENLFLPHWFWGIIMTITSLEILLQSLRIAYFI